MFNNQRKLKAQGLCMRFYNLEYLRRHVKLKPRISERLILNGKYIHVTIHYFLVSYFHNYEELCSDFEMEQ